MNKVVNVYTCTDCEGFLEAENQPVCKSCSNTMENIGWFEYVDFEDGSGILINEVESQRDCEV